MGGRSRFILRRRRTRSDALYSLSNSVKRYAVKSKTVSERGVEDTIEVRIAQTSTSFVNELRSVHGVRAATLVSYNGEYMS